jgi:sugar phosphate isomerase/epimerase
MMFRIDSVVAAPVANLFFPPDRNDWTSMTTFSFASSIIKSSSPRPSIEWAIEYGFNGVEFNAPDIRLADVSADDRRFLLAMASEHGLRYTHHFPSTASPGSHDEARRERDRTELVSEINVAGELGIEVIVVHPGKLDVPGIEQEDVSEAARIEALSFFVDSMRATAPTAEAAGVVVGLENMHYIPGWLIRAHHELAEAVDAIASPAVGITFDAGHAWGSGGIDAGIETFGDRIRHVQVHDARGPEGAGNVRDQHMEIGTGVLDFVTVGNLVRSKPLIVTLETSARGDDPEGAAARSRDVLQQIWG